MANSNSILQQVSSRDTGKRGRLVFLAIFITLALFFMRAFNFWVVAPGVDLIVKALVFGVFTYISLIWAFKLEINARSLLIVIPQSVLFVMGYVLFIELFFFRQFERALDFFVLFIVWGAGFLLLYVSFLMTNIFNVSMFKEIPLKQVAKTTSYILSLVMVYLYSFSVLALQVNFAYSAGLLAIAYSIIVYLHFYHLNLSPKNLINALVVVLVGMLASIISFMFIGSQHEIIALMPTATAFAVIGITMHKTRTEGFSTVNQVEYLLVYFAILAINLWLA